jgi:hypothetical protein
MPNKDSSAKPRSRYHVEEVVEEETPKHKHIDEPSEKHVEEKHPHTAPKITSFSMMDRPSAKAEEVESSEKSEPEEVAKKPVETTHEEESPSIVTEKEPAEESETVGEEGGSEPESDVPPNEISQWLQSVRPDTTSGAGGQGGKGKFIAIFLIVLILAALGGGVYYYQANVENTPVETEEKTPSTTTENISSAPTTAPSPTVAAIDLSKYKLQILNGAGIAGEAGKAQGYLTTAGFKDFKTGNASAFNFASTEVSLKKDTPEEVFTKIKAALDTYYQDVKKAEKALDEKSEFDASITVGKRK